MAKSFTHYWKHETWHRSTTGEKVLDHTAGNRFKVCRVRPGDAVYIISRDAGRLRLIGRMVVHKIVNGREAREYLGRDDLWEADDHCVAAPDDATPIQRDLIVDDLVTRRLRFKGKGGEERALVFRSGDLDEQTLRGVRQLTPESAALLESLLSPL